MVDLFDASGRPVGVAGKRAAHRLGWWHFVFHCWLYRVGGGIILQRRGPGKKVYPGLYDISAAGHYTAGEGVADGVREIGEELARSGGGRGDFAARRVGAVLRVLVVGAGGRHPVRRRGMAGFSRSGGAG
jgi:hypothetical protein